MNDMVPWIEKLTGENVPLKRLPCGRFPLGGIGYGQFNELLLALGYDRVSPDFFRYIFGSDEVRTFRDFRKGVEAFRKKSMLMHGNFKYSFKTHHHASLPHLKNTFDRLSIVDTSAFSERHQPLLELQSISRNEAPVLGYLSGPELEDLGIAPSEPEKTAIIQKGIHNHRCYLTYDHLDVYVATSMRKAFDYWNVHNFRIRDF
jgi:hypothetical protein